jgi:hypothetical protein
MNQGSFYGVDTCLASCFVGFLLTSKKSVALKGREWAKKKTMRSICALCTQPCYEISLLQQARQQSEPTVELMKPQKLQKKKLSHL